MVEIKLIDNNYAFFFNDAAAVRREIADETDRITGKTKQISNVPIHLSIYSPNGMFFTLIRVRFFTLSSNYKTYSLKKDLSPTYSKIIPCFFLFLLICICTWMQKTFHFSCFLSNSLAWLLPPPHEALASSGKKITYMHLRKKRNFCKVLWTEW